MIWHLVAAIFAGLAAAGIGLTLRVISRKRLPRWIVPVCAGLGMLGYQIHYEYNWFNHKQQQLPDTAQVVATEQSQVFWRPWTYVYPMTTRFSVVDRNSQVVREADDQRLVEFLLYRFEKEYVDQVSHQAYLMNCSTREMLPLVGEQRRPQPERLRRLDESAAVFQAVCNDA